MDEVRRLTPFAVELRYDQLSEADEEHLDRSWAVDCVRRTRQWAESMTRKAGQVESQ
jgi:hypothetical protein